MLKSALVRLSAPRPVAITALFLTAIGVGSLIGAATSVGDGLGGLVDPLVLLLVGTLFFTIRLDGAPALRHAPRVVLLAIGMNFLLIPVVAFILTSLLVPDDALRIGVLIYCLFPCTDWFLGFTRMAGGDTTVGAALIPIQLVLQLALYPVWLGVFAGEQVDATFTEAGPALLTWFVVPAMIALVLRGALRLVASRTAQARIVDAVDTAVPMVIATLIVCLFAANVRTILAEPFAFSWVLLVVFLFFVITYVIGEGASRLFRLRDPEHALLTMTTSARNAPLMLAVTTIALPGQPVIAAAIVIGMLIEFPHLTVLTHLLRIRRERGQTAVASDANGVRSPIG